MSGNIVTIRNDQLIVEPQGLDKLWSVTKRLAIPLDDVLGATHDPGIGRDRKGWRGPGLHTGDKLAGTFHEGGQKQFWNVSGYVNAVVIGLRPGQKFNRLVLSVEEPDAVVDMINEAVHRHSSATDRTPNAR